MHFDIDSTVQCKNYLKKTASICSNAIAWIFPRAYSTKLKFDWTKRKINRLDPNLAKGKASIENFNDIDTYQNRIKLCI